MKKGGRTVYFGNIGSNSKEIINYFERNSAVKCKPDENPAEYILQVIGAGATAKADRDWADIWEQSLDGRAAIDETIAIKVEYKESADPAQHDEPEGSYAVSWLTQYKAVQRRAFQIYWRSPEYIMGKVVLNVVAGLFLGFTFYIQKDASVQAMQNKVSFLPLPQSMAVKLTHQ